jgi:hypothetical protein
MATISPAASLTRAVLAAVLVAASIASAAGQACSPRASFPLPKGGVGSPVISVGDQVSCILRDGGVFCFGRNSRGSLGLGDTRERGHTQFLSELFEPGFRLPLPADVAQVDAGYRSPCVLFVDGKIMCWVRRGAPPGVAYGPGGAGRLLETHSTRPPPSKRRF